MRVLIDVGGLLLLLLNLAAGYRFGLLRRALVFGGLFGAVGLATLIGNGTARNFHDAGVPGALYADQWAFISLFLGAILVVEVIGVLYDEKITRVASLMFDRSVGVLLGLFVGALEVAVICVVCFATGHASPPDSATPLPAERMDVATSVQDSILGGAVYRVESGILNVFKPVLPSDLPAHLAESARKR